MDSTGPALPPEPTAAATAAQAEASAAFLRALARARAAACLAALLEERSQASDVLRQADGGMSSNSAAIGLEDATGGGGTLHRG